MRQIVLFIYRHGKVPLFCFVLCAAFSVMTVRTTEALVDGDVKGLRKGIRETNLLNKPQARDEGQTKASADSTSGKQYQSTSSPLKAEPVASGENEPTSLLTGGVEPLPRIDASSVLYSPLTSAPFRAMTAASIVSATPSTANSSFSAAPVEASPSGWKIGGVAWYWWLSSLLAIGMVTQWYVYKKRQAGSAKIGQ